MRRLLTTTYLCLSLAGAAKADAPERCFDADTVKAAAIVRGGDAFVIDRDESAFVRVWSLEHDAPIDPAATYIVIHMTNFRLRSIRADGTICGSDRALDFTDDSFARFIAEVQALEEEAARKPKEAK